MSTANETYKKSPIIRYDLVEREYDKFWVRVYSKNRYFDEIVYGYDLVERKDDKFWVRIYIGNRYFDEIVYRKLCLNANENKLAELKLMEKEDI